MPNKRHEDLRNFAIRILSYMGIFEIEHEKTIEFEYLNEKHRYRIDVVGIKKGTYLDEKEQCVLIEIGNNQFDKINVLRLAGYNVMVIPYSENEEEWHDEKRLLKIMNESNKRLYDNFYKLSRTWQNIADTKIEEINAKNIGIEQLESDVEHLKDTIKFMYSILKDTKESFSKLSVPCSLFR